VRGAQHQQKLGIEGAKRGNQVGGDISQQGRQRTELGRIQIPQAHHAVDAHGYPPII
jgi:hypothetical protein